MTPKKFPRAFRRGTRMLAAVADRNRLSVLFPKTKASAVDPQGCWDWWGYIDIDCLGREAIGSMVERPASQTVRRN